jgi:hypothetical protein
MLSVWIFFPFFFSKSFNIFCSVCSVSSFFYSVLIFYRLWRWRSLLHLRIPLGPFRLCIFYLKHLEILKIHIFWYVTLCVWASGHRRFDGTNFETSVTTHPMTHRHIPDDLNPQQYRRDNLKSYTFIRVQLRICSIFFRWFAFSWCFFSEVYYLLLVHCHILFRNWYSAFQQLSVKLRKVP